MNIRTLVLAICLLHPLAQVQAASLEVTAIQQRAEQGDALAQHDLGHRYAKGEGLPRDLEQAEIWFRRAAEQGNAQSQSVMGGMYYMGFGLKQDFQQAAVWFRRAAEQGEARAQAYLGGMYYKGQGVEPDKGLAYAWLSVAAAGKQQPSQEAQALVIKALRLMDEELPATELARAKQLASEYAEKYRRVD
jgi:hypothetical protein